MSRSTVVYLIVLIVSATAVTFILQYGMRLAAPPDVSGEWQVGRIDAGSPPPERALGRRLVVEQSGRFVRLNFQSGLTIDAKLHYEELGGVTLRFRGKDWELTAEGKDRDGPLVCQLIGGERYPFTLTRPAAATIASTGRPPGPTIAERRARPGRPTTGAETADVDPDADADAP
jgi:hypothetical protein